VLRNDDSGRPARTANFVPCPYPDETCADHPCPAFV